MKKKTNGNNEKVVKKFHLWWRCSESVTKKKGIYLVINLHLLKNNKKRKGNKIHTKATDEQQAKTVTRDFQQG